MSLNIARLYAICYTERNTDM